MRCNLCGFSTFNVEDFENHLKEYHFINYQDYCELELTHKSEFSKNSCFRCNSIRSPLTTLYRDFYYLPCWNCYSSGVMKKIEKQETIGSVRKNIKSYLDYFLGDRYFQLFSVDGLYFRSTYTHDYSEFKKVLSNLQLPNRNDIWVIDWNLGYPKIISVNNLNGINLINLTNHYNVVSSKDCIEVNNYRLLLPEFTNYDKQHFSRYNILNINSDRKTKRVKVDSSCIKLFNSRNNVKSIFRLVDKTTLDEIDLDQISHQDYIVLKLVLMRNKFYMRLVFSIILELIKSIKTLSDSVFIKNTIVIDPDKDAQLNIMWDYKNSRNNYINISIL